MKVVLHGPSLFNSGPRGAEEKEAPTSSEERVLRQIVIALYHAAAQVFAKRYRAIAERHPAGFNYSPTRPLRFGLSRELLDQELLEKAAQLRIDLDGAPGLAVLRSYWDAFGLLELGVLREIKEHDVSFGTKGSDQGFRELVALASAAQAYRVVTGKFEVTEEEKRQDEAKASLSGDSKIEAKDVINGAVSLAVGAALGMATLQQTGSPVAAALGGALTTAITNASIGFSASRSRTTTRSQEVKFLPDRSVTSLLRMLPELIQRFRDCDLVPVFVIDELDKVPELETKLPQIVRYLKMFFTEKAFFCFLTGREYMEYVTSQLAENPYSDLHTAFTNRSFVIYRADALHRYLDEVLRIEDASDRASVIDREILSYALLQKSRMHPFDLQREIRALLSPDGAITLAPGSTTGNMTFRLAAMMQVAVEVVLSDTFLADRIRENPEFAQLAYDALYYPSKVWSQGQRTLKLKAESFVADIRTPGATAHSVAETDNQLLFTQVRRLIHLVSNPSALKKEPAIRTLNVPQSVLDAFPNTFELIGADPQDSYTWFRNTFGHPYLTRDVTKIDTPELHAAEEWLDSFYAAWGAAGAPPLDDCAIKYRILPTSPLHSQVQDARSRFAMLRDTGLPYPDMESDAEDIVSFTQRLKARSAALAQSLLLAEDAKRHGTGLTTLTEGLTSVSAALSLSLVDASHATIERIFKERYGALASETFGVIRAARGRVVDVNVDEWRSSFTRGQEALQAVPPLGTQAHWGTRFRQFLQPNGPVSFDPEFYDIVLHLTGRPTFINPRLDQIPLATWSGLFSEAVQGAKSDWLAVPALVALGFGAYAGVLFESFVRSSKVSPIFREFLELAKARPVTTTPTVMLIRADTPGPSSEWLVTPGASCISLTKAQWSKLYADANLNMGALTFSFTLAELPHNLQTFQNPQAIRESVLDAKWPQYIRSPERPFAFLTPRNRTGLSIPAGVPLVPYARDLSQAIEELTASDRP